MMRSVGIHLHRYETAQEGVQRRTVWEDVQIQIGKWKSFKEK